MSLYNKFKKYNKDELCSAATKLEAMLAFHIDNLRKLEEEDTLDSTYDDRNTKYARIRKDFKTLKDQLIEKKYPRKESMHDTAKETIGEPKKKDEEKPASYFEDEDEKFAKLQAAYNLLVEDLEEKENEISKLESQLENKQAIIEEKSRKINNLRESKSSPAASTNSNNSQASQSDEHIKSIDKNTPICSGREHQRLDLRCRKQLRQSKHPK